MSETDSKPRVLFLCTGNSCRSQMAEGIAKRLFKNRLEIYSAGIEKHGMNPFAMKVMSEAGMDISDQSSQTLEEVGLDFDHVITVCDHANNHRPDFPSKTQIHHFPFPDPPKLAAEVDCDELKLNCYRKVRNEIQESMENIVAAIG